MADTGRSWNFESFLIISRSPGVVVSARTGRPRFVKMTREMWPQIRARKLNVKLRPELSLRMISSVLGDILGETGAVDDSTSIRRQAFW